MFIKLIKRSSIVFLALNFVACSLFTPAATPSAADIEKEEQAVYSFFVYDPGGVAIILENTSTNISEDDPQETIDYIKSGLKSISNEAIDSYLARNSQSSQLASDMNLGMDYVLLTRDELAEISSGPNWGELLTEKYPNSYGYTIFSRVGFNNLLDQAVIYVGNVAGPLMGAGYYYLMEKKNGEWIIREQVMVWIS
ncbi:MAG: hypothetical protein H7Y59_02925 [Anaerolineales bacterium]|nr:hypothetical protein [Anaerolineales bacterium]